MYSAPRACSSGMIEPLRHEICYVVAQLGLVELRYLKLFRWFDDPYVAELHRHSVFLQLNWTCGSFAKLCSVESHRPQGLVLVHHLSVEQQRHYGVGCLLAGCIEAWGLKVDVKGLPFEHWTRGTDAGLGRNRVVKLPVWVSRQAPIRFVDVRLISVLDVDATVGGTSNIAELNVNLRVAECLMANAVSSARDRLHGLAWNKMPGARTVFLQPFFLHHLRPRAH